MNHRLDYKTCKRIEYCVPPCSYEQSLIKVLLHNLKYKILYKLTNDEDFKC
jgi:hypothetical protein